MCECQVCRDIARWNEAIRGDDVEKRVAVFQEMFERIELAETDLAYFRAIFAGEWPSSQQLLERALAKVKEQNEAQANLEAVQRKHGIIE